MPPRSRLPFTPALLAIGIGLAAFNWYLQPQAAVAWVSATVFLIVGLGVWGYVTIVLRRPETARTSRQAWTSIRGALVFAGLMIAISLGLKLAMSFSVVNDPDLSQRSTMVLLGAFFVFTGNALPKMLTPLSTLRCDAAKAQALQRFSAWAWVIAGLGFGYVWLVLPVKVAEPVSVAVLLGATLIIAVHTIRVCRTSHPVA